LSLRPSDVLMVVASADVGVSDAIHDTGNGNFRGALVHPQLDGGECVRLFLALSYVLWWRRRELSFAAADPRKTATWNVNPCWITFWRRLHDFDKQLSEGLFIENVAAAAVLKGAKNLNLNAKSEGLLRQRLRLNFKGEQVRRNEIEVKGPTG
jgi:hypothetical protein